MPELSEKVCFTLDQELPESEAPEFVQVLPSGEVDPKGKTSFLVDEEARRLIIAAFNEGKTDLVVDYEHQSLSGSEAPAAGWIKDLADRGEDGLWGRVQWTERAREYLRNREYRYLSPVILIRKKDGRAVQLLGAALTNLPAIEGMTPVVNSAISDPEGFVPRAEYEALKETLKAIEADVLIKEALACGRLTPSLLPWARDYALKDMEGFREFLGKACPVVPVGTREPAPAALVDQAQRSVNALLGIEDEIFLRYIEV